MAINKKLIHFNEKSVFSQKLANNELLDTSIVFIKDTQEIWTHGQLYKCSDPDLSKYLTEEDLAGINKSISDLNTAVAGKQATISDLATIRSGAAAGATAVQPNALNSYVPTSRTINNKPLSANISLSAGDVGAPTTTQFNNLQTTVNGKLDSTTASDTYATKTALTNGLAGKQATISDLSTIRSGASKGATALQADDLDDINESISDLQTALGNKAESSALSNYATTTALNNGLAEKQATLVSGTNIKTIEGKSILGSGDIQISAENVGAYTTAQVDDKVTSLTTSISSVSGVANAAKSAITTLNGTETTTGSVKATAKSYADSAKSSANSYTDGKIATVNEAVSTNATAISNLTTTVSGKATKATTLSGYDITDGVNAVSATSSGSFVTGISIDATDKHKLNITKGNVDLSGYATTSSLNTTNTNVSNLTSTVNTLKDTTVPAIATRVSTIEGMIEADGTADTSLNKWKEVVAFLDGIDESENLEDMLLLKANQSSLDATNTTIANLKTSQVAESGNLYFTDARARSAIIGGASTIAGSNLTVSRALVSNSSGKVAVSDVTSTELSYLDGVTSNIQTQLDNKASKSVETTAANNASAITTLQGYFTSGKAKTAASADSAATATALTVKSKGSATNPIYWDANGQPVACTYSLNKTVPSDAKFTDTNTWRGITDSVSTADSTISGSATAVKTAYDKAVSAYNLANGKTANTGTVTKVSTGAGLTGGDITTSGTIKCKLNSETSLGTIGSTSKLYAVGVDANGKLCVNVPWTDNNTTYGDATTSASGLMTAAMVTKLNGIATGATAVTTSTVSGWGYTKNAGTITGITMNGVSKGTSGVVDLGTVLTAHQDLSSYATQTWVNNKGYTTNKGTVTSVAMTVPTGLSVSGTPITSSGTLAVSLASGYSIPTTAKQTNWDTAYGWGNHASAGYTKNTGTVTSIATGTGLTGGTITGSGTISMSSTYQTYCTNGNSAWASYLAVTSVSNINNGYKFVKATISANASLTLNGTMTAGRDIHIVVYNSGSSSITVSLPTASPYVNLTDDAITIPAKGYGEINIISDGTNMYIRSIA